MRLVSTTSLFAMHGLFLFIMNCATVTKLTTLLVTIRNFMAGAERLDTYSMRSGPYRGLPG
jgi:hypothetical protein